MNCLVCNRNNAFNLSICPSCGAMMNDSVREELLPKISVSKPLKLEIIEMTENSPSSGKLNLPPAVVKEKITQPVPVTANAPVIANKPIAANKSIAANMPVAANTPKVAPVAVNTPKSAPVAAVKSNTSELLAPKPTSPTLVEFHSKNSSVPEWRLQLQNVVRQRHERESQPPEKSISPAAPRKAKLAASGANALKIEVIEEKKPEQLKNTALSSALERIEKSRQKFLVAEELPIEPTPAAPRPANKNFPFYIASKQAEAAPNTADAKTSVNPPAAKPKLAASLKTESVDLNTNKLPTLPQPPKVSTNFVKSQVNSPQIEVKAEKKKEIKVKPLESEEIIPAEENHEEFEDCAPFAMRFNAGLFDLIIGAFASLFLLSPFMLTGSDWLTFTGLLAFLATCSVVMFIYLTTTIGFYGRTFGMRLFSLEVVDIEGEHYPTLHQAAVSSAVYILSLALGGIGFLTLAFNEEKRAVHDLVSGTIVVKEN